MGGRRESIGDLPYLQPGLLPNGEGGSLGPVAQPQFRQQVPHVVLDGLSGYVQAIGDLGVG